MDKVEKTSCKNCKCNSSYLHFLPRIIIATAVIFVFYIALSTVYYTFIFGEMWFNTLNNTPAEMLMPTTATLFFMLFANIAGAFVTVNIFYVYLKRIAIARADKQCKIHWCMLIPVVFLLSGFYFTSSAMNVVFDVYTLTHLLIETGYLFLGLSFSGYIVSKLLKSKFDSM